VASEEGEHGGVDAAAAAAAEQVFAVGVPVDHQELPRGRVRSAPARRLLVLAIAGSFPGRRRGTPDRPQSSSAMILCGD
jgi:hypothetical protein